MTAARHQSGNEPVDPHLAERIRVALERCTAEVARVQDRINRMLVRNETLQVALQLLWIALPMLAVWLGWSRFASITRDAQAASTPTTRADAPTRHPTPESP